MSEPRIDENWHGDDDIRLRPFLVIGIPVLVLAVVIVLGVFKGHTELGRHGSQDVYDPAACVDEGFVGSANALLAELLRDTTATDTAVDLESLNRKYRALTFALPYGEESKSVIEASDLRLTGINPERIRNARNRKFYYNSRLPQLLSSQAAQPAETFFRIRCKALGYDAQSGTKPISVTSVEVIPSMFKVALRKDPWTGEILGARNCLFDEGRTVYVTYGNSMLPLPIEQTPAAISDTYRYNAVSDEAILCDARFGSIDYYNHYRTFFTGDDTQRRKSLAITLNQSRTERSTRSVCLCCADGFVYVRTDVPMVAFTSRGEQKIPVYERESQSSKGKVALEDGLKLVAYDTHSHKLGEFTIYTHDPTVTLSRLIQTNVGRQRYNIGKSQTDLFTRQVIRGVSRNLGNTFSTDTVRLSLDPMLSREFETEIRSYLSQVMRGINANRPKCQQHQEYDMSVTVMDITTGDIIASPYHTTLFDHPDISDTLRLGTRNPAMSRRFIGSTFKPMVALAAVQTNPRLLSLDTHGKYSADWTQGTALFFGRRTKVWAESAKSHWGGTTFAPFLAYSDDVYPVALAALAMTDANVSGSVSTLPLTGANNLFSSASRTLRFKDSKSETVHTDPNTHPFSKWVSHLYAANVKQDYTTDTILFQNLYKDIERARTEGLTSEERIYGLESLCPDVTNLRFDRFFEGGDMRTHLVPWVLGQGDNQWSCIKVAEAWSRMLGKRDVRASLIHTDTIPPSLVSVSELSTVDRKLPTAASVNNTWNGFLSEFRTAQGLALPNNTLRRMYDEVQTLNSALGTDLVLFSKTGTPDSYLRYEKTLLGGNKRQIDVGMYSFCLMTESQYSRIRSDNPGHGIVCIIRITRTFDCQHCNRLGNKCSTCRSYQGLQSSHAVRFFAGHPERLRKFYDMTRRYFTGK